MVVDWYQESMYNGVGYTIINPCWYLVDTQVIVVQSVHCTRVDSTLHVTSLNSCMTSQYSCNYYRSVSEIEIK